MPSESELLDYLPGVRSLLRRMTRDVQLARDLSQDVLLATIQALRAGRISDPSAIAGYMCQIARHLVYADRRRSNPLISDNLPDTASTWADTPRTPLETCEIQELQIMARATLAELPTARDRDLLYGFYVDGLGKAELMIRLQLTSEQFDRVIHRARQRMCERMRAKMNGGQPQVGESAPTGNPASTDTRTE